MLLNHFTDVLSYDTEWNLTTTISYLNEKLNDLSFPDTNQNEKNCYQLVGRSCADMVVEYCVDPCILKL